MYQSNRGHAIFSKLCTYWLQKWGQKRWHGRIIGHLMCHSSNLERIFDREVYTFFCHHLLLSYSLYFLRRLQKLEKSSSSFWHYVVSVKSTVKISSIFVAFLENMNLKGMQKIRIWTLTFIIWLEFRINILRCFD